MFEELFCLFFFSRLWAPSFFWKKKLVLVFIYSLAWGDSVHALSILWKASLDGRGIWVAVRPQRTEPDSDEGVAPSLCQDEVWPLGCDVSGWMISVSSKDYVLSPPLFFWKGCNSKNMAHCLIPLTWICGRGGTCKVADEGLLWSGSFDCMPLAK